MLKNRGQTRSNETETILKSEASAEAVGVFIAESSRMGCQLMAAALRRGRYRLAVVGFAMDTTETLTVLSKTRADVAVISAHLRDGAAAGLTAAREIRASYPNIRVIIVLDSIEDAIVVESFRAGASGIFSREEPFELMCKCIHAVHRGQIWANSKAMRFVVDALARTSVEAVDSKLSRGQFLLTERERTVVRLVAEGLTNRDISRQLNLSEHTVRNYLFRIFNKVGASTRLELALYVVSQRTANEHSSTV
jgi:two-component system nitrate/nitrite response regulator NarL